MKNQTFRCCCCRRICRLRVAAQKYCGAKECQLARKRAWRKEKYKSDPDYRLNQKASTQKWMSEKGGAAQYYREYRKRKRRDFENSKKEVASLALMELGEESLFVGGAAVSDASANRDANEFIMPIKSGRYRMSLCGANRDAFLAEIQLISNG